MSAPPRLPVTAVIAARDAAADIADCVASVAWAAEVLVVENDSADDTVDRARAAGATVFSHPFATIGGQRNAAIARAAHEWILVLDADERCTPELAAEVAALVAAGAPPYDAFHVGRRNFFLGREIRHGGWERDRPVRFFRRTLRYDESPVHERVVVPGAAGALSGRLLHTPYASLGSYFDKLNRYSRWWAGRQFARGRRAGMGALVLRPPARFAVMYLVRLGCLDGTRGFLLALLAAVSVAAKYARLWELGLRGTPAPSSPGAADD